MMLFHRRIVLTRRSTGAGSHVRAALEDDYHHFQLELLTDGCSVTSVRGWASRHPYSLCPSAAQALTRLEGMALSSNAHAVTQHTEAHQQCTHLFDLAGLACALAARHLERRVFDAMVEVPPRGPRRATLHRDGELAISWVVDGWSILDPPPYAGVDLRQGLARWALSTLDVDAAEDALVLRRCTVISLGRTKPLDQQVHARTSGACYVQQPERAPLALRQVGSTWDFAGRADVLCADDQRWLAHDA